MSQLYIWQHVAFEGESIPGRQLDLHGELKLYNMDYDNAMEDPTSAAYKQHSDSICSDVCTVLFPFLFLNSEIKITFTEQLWIFNDVLTSEVKASRNCL